MVKFSDAALDRTFAALSDPTRRALVMRLAAEPDLSVSELAAPFAMSLPAVMKHLDVLSDAGLVSRSQDRARRRLPARRRADARRVRVAQSLRKVLVRAAVQSRRVFGRGRRIMSTQTATKPSLTLKRRLKAPPAKVFAAWTDPEKVKRWMGPGEVKAVNAECDLARRRPLSLADANAERRRARRQRRLSRSRSRTRNSSSPGPGSRRRSANRW